MFGLRYADVRWQLDRPIVAELTGDAELDLAMQGVGAVASTANVPVVFRPNPPSDAKVK